MKHRIFTTIILTAVLLAGCGAEEKSEPEPAEEFEPVITITKEPTPEPTFAPIEPVEVTPTATPTPTAIPTPTPTAMPTTTPEPIQASIAEEKPVVELTTTPEPTLEPIPEPTPKPEPTEEPEQSPVGTYLGTFTISFYCPCEICTGKWSGGATASGVMPTPWYTCAASDLPFGTVIQIDGLGTFEVQDRGVGSGWIDVFVSDHQEALNLGLQSRDVYIVG